jgi:hypothetical protein
VTERWTITRRVPSGIPGDDWHIAEGPDPGGDPAGIEVVPASHLAGAWQTINEIEEALTDHGIAITSPLVDAILPLLTAQTDVQNQTGAAD